MGRKYLIQKGLFDTPSACGGVVHLPAALIKLDRYDLLVVDNLGYVKKSEAETSVLFELIALHLATATEG